MYEWVLGIASIVIGVALLYFVFQKRYKEAFFLELLMWIVIILDLSMNFNFGKPQAYLSIGIIIAFIGRILLFLKKK